MGGLIAQDVALREPSRILTLAFLCTFARGRQATRLTAALLLTSLRMRIGPRAARRRAFLELVMPESYPRQVDRAALAARLESLFGYDLASQPPFVMRQLRAMARFDRAGRLAALGGIPSLIVSAAEDRTARPADGRELASLIPRARYVEIPDAGHAVTIQRADVVNGLLARHWEEASDSCSRSKDFPSWKRGICEVFSAAAPLPRLIGDERAATHDIFWKLPTCRPISRRRGSVYGNASASPGS